MYCIAIYDNHSPGKLAALLGAKETARLLGEPEEFTKFCTVQAMLDRSWFFEPERKGE